VTFLGAEGLEKKQNHASGGKVSHLESWLPLRFALRSSGQIAMAFVADYARH